MSIVEQNQDQKDVVYDFCIIGTGPAGLTLCNELLSSGKRICIIESGAQDFQKTNPKLKKVISTGEIVIKEKSRERGFGGTSSTWAGLSAPLDPIDFTRWPISYDDTLPYYKKLSTYGFAPFEEFLPEYFEEIKKTGDFVFNPTQLEEKVFIARDPAVHFGKKFQSILTNENVDLYLESTVTKLELGSEEAGKKKLRSLFIVSPNGARKEIRANTFIVCAGGIESTKLLLLPSENHPQGVGNEFGQVGKYLMNHPKSNFGIIELSKPITNAPYIFGYLHNNFARYIGLRIREDIQMELGLLNSYIRFEPMYPWTDSSGVYALITLTKRMKTFLTWWKNRQKGIVELKDWNETGDDSDAVEKRNTEPGVFFMAFTVALDLKAVIPYAISRLRKQSVVPIKKIRIRNFMEMEPSIRNTLTLGSELDIFGNPIPIVHTSTSSLDKKSLIKLHEFLKKEIENSSLGTYVGNLEEVNPWPIHFDASHHLGGTIMGNDPRSSVVNSNLKVHSVDNMYVCSGSVFPTSGCANPTYTICALAVRLAGHLKTL